MLLFLAVKCPEERRFCNLPTHNATLFRCQKFSQYSAGSIYLFHNKHPDWVRLTSYKESLFKRYDYLICISGFQTTHLSCFWTYCLRHSSILSEKSNAVINPELGDMVIPSHHYQCSRPKVAQHYPQTIWLTASEWYKFNLFFLTLGITSLSHLQFL